MTWCCGSILQKLISSAYLLPSNLFEVWCHSAGSLYFILLQSGLWCPIDCPCATSATAVISLGFCTLALRRDGGNLGYLGVVLLLLGPVPRRLLHGFVSLFFPMILSHLLGGKKSNSTLVMMVSSLLKPRKASKYIECVHSNTASEKTNEVGKHPLHPRVGTYRFLSSFKIWLAFFLGIQLYTFVVLGWLTNHGHGWLNVAKDTCVPNNNMRTYFRYRKKKLHFLRPLQWGFQAAQSVESWNARTKNKVSLSGNVPWHHARATSLSRKPKRFIQKDKQDFVYYLPETNYYFLFWHKSTNTYKYMLSKFANSHVFIRCKGWHIWCPSITPTS